MELSKINEMFVQHFHCDIIELSAIKKFLPKFPGFPDAGPYDAIHVGAAAHMIPQDLLSQLKLGGRMVIPLGSETGGQWLEQIDKRADGTIERKKLMGVRYVPLTDKEKQWY